MISVIGGSGFIGTKLCKTLSNKGRNFEILDIAPSRQFSEARKNVDICEIDTLRKGLTGDTIIHLAAVHRDDVRPISMYDTVNIEGTRNVCLIAEEKKINKIIFTSSVAVYGFSAPDTDEHGKITPYNDYGRTKYEAEKVLREWQEKDPKHRTLIILRPTVVFGEGNRGNVYNLLRQIQSGIFVMIGAGHNRKSMAYVENIVAFIEHTLKINGGVSTFNYIDKPDFDMNELVSLVKKKVKGVDKVGIRLPLWIGTALGYSADIVATIIRRNLPVSSIRIKKFTSTTTFATSNDFVNNFKKPYSLSEGMERTLQAEFLDRDENAEKFYTE